VIFGRILNQPLRGHFLALAGQHDVAMRMVDADVAAAETTGIPYSMAIAYYSKGRTFAEAEPTTAITAYEHAISIARDSGNRFWEQLVVADMAALQARAGIRRRRSPRFGKCWTYGGAPPMRWGLRMALVASSSCSNRSAGR
jgi:hypothetical protein